MGQWRAPGCIFCAAVAFLFAFIINGTTLQVLIYMIFGVPSDCTSDGANHHEIA
jgi:hypothetical protein